MVEGLQILEGEDDIHQGPQECEGMECRLLAQRGQGLRRRGIQVCERESWPKGRAGEPLCRCS